MEERKWPKGWKAAHEANTIHGMSKTRTFRVWTNMLARCRNPARRGYPTYGGRGITVCDRWDSFENFLADMGEAPAGKQLDRIDNDKGYSPENCQWTTPRENCLNRSTTHWIEFNGVKKCITEWAAGLGLTRQAVHRRIAVMGWPLERALTEAKRGTK